MIIRKYQTSDEKGWVYCKALSYLFSPFFDDRETEKSELMTDVYDYRVEWVAEVDEQIVGLIDIDIYTEECSQSYIYAPSKRTAYFTNLAVHPDFQGQGIAQVLFEKAEQEKKEYFEEGTMIGWMLCRPGVRMVIDTKIFNTHEKYFSEKNTIFILKDNAEVEEQYYCYKW